MKLVFQRITISILKVVEFSSTKLVAGTGFKVVVSVPYSVSEKSRSFNEALPPVFRVAKESSFDTLFIGTFEQKA